jgi:hypothetical protein
MPFKFASTDTTEYSCKPLTPYPSHDATLTGSGNLQTVSMNRYAIENILNVSSKILQSNATQEDYGPLD